MVSKAWTKSESKQKRHWVAEVTTIMAAVTHYWIHNPTFLRAIDSDTTNFDALSITDTREDQKSSSNPKELHSYFRTQLGTSLCAH